MSTTKTFPPLYKKTSTGKIQMWRISVQEDRNGHGVITVRQGQVDGKQQEYIDTVTEGKNAGRKNATTPFEQAVKEAQAEWAKKKDRKHYGEDEAGEESAAKRSCAPMLAEKFQDHVKKVDWDNAYAQPKYDGNRAFIFRENDQIQVVSREGKIVETVPHITDDLLAVMQNGETFDGELYVHGMPLNKIRSLVTRMQPDSAKLQIRLYDVVSPAPFANRYALLSKRMKARHSEALVLSETIPVDSEDDLMLYQARCIEDGYEGAILRHGKVPYEAGKRSRSLLKVKTFLDDEFDIIGVEEGRGTHKGMAILVCQTGEGFKFDVTAPGSHEEKREAWRNRKQLIGKRVTVKFAFMTKTDEPKPFHPVAKEILP